VLLKWQTEKKLTTRIQSNRINMLIGTGVFSNANIIL